MTREMEGGCHCGAVRFRAPFEELRAIECNCSRCRMLGFLHLFVPLQRFELLRGQAELETYRFNTGAAQHFFCRRCGIQSFYRPRSHPDHYSINARCLDGIDPDQIEREPFDGQNWEAHVESIR